jgi:hypothetical protein
MVRSQRGNPRLGSRLGDLRRQRAKSARKEFWRRQVHSVLEPAPQLFYIEGYSDRDRNPS